MEQTRATITRDDSGEAVTAVDARLTLTAGRGYRWGGSFPVAQQAGVRPYALYRLTTTDGRTGPILVTAVRGDTVHFQGAGPLSNPS